jgi:peptide-methionine (S)-S-oxide reductase
MRFAKSWLVLLALGLGLSAAVVLGGRFAAPETASTLVPDEVPPGMERATFGAGCFWCTEAVFRQVKGVESVVAGYCGGSVKDPTYRQVGTKTTGHAEAVQITYDPDVISYADLLEIFWQTHDPTTRDRQGRDVGPQYRSVIFYHTDEQRRLAEEYKQKLDAAGVFGRPVVTEIVPFRAFYRAEGYHQDYYAKNPWQPYCSAVIRPKLEKLNKVFHDKLSNEPLGTRPVQAGR